MEEEPRVGGKRTRSGSRTLAVPVTRDREGAPVAIPANAAMFLKPPRTPGGAKRGPASLPPARAGYRGAEEWRSGAECPESPRGGSLPRSVARNQRSQQDRRAFTCASLLNDI